MNYLTYDYVFLSANILLSYTYANSEKFLVPGFITFTFMGKIYSTLPKCHEKIVCVIFSKLLGHEDGEKCCKYISSQAFELYSKCCLASCTFLLGNSRLGNGLKSSRIFRKNLFYVKDPSFSDAKVVLLTPDPSHCKMLT